MLNEHVYCPRLAYLEWADARFADSADTVEGRWVHRNVDVERGALVQPEHLTDEAPRTTSLTISSERLGLIATIDVVEHEGGKLVPLEYKRGRPRSGDSPLWEPELIEICAQVLLLRDAGYDVDHAEVYFNETRTRHRVDIDQPAIDQTLSSIAELRTNAERTSSAAAC